MTLPHHEIACLAMTFFPHFGAELGPKLSFPVLAPRDTQLHYKDPMGSWWSFFSSTCSAWGCSDQSALAMSQLTPIVRAPVLHQLPQPAEPCGQGLPGRAVAHGTAPGHLLQRCWQPKHGTGPKCFGWVGQHRDIPDGADTVPVAWGELSLPCARCTGKGFWVALVKVCRCQGPAEAFGAATLPLQSIVPMVTPLGQTEMGLQTCRFLLYC